MVEKYVETKTAKSRGRVKKSYSIVRRITKFLENHLIFKDEIRIEEQISRIFR
jgi:hypothetical protein